ncbi:hypothetical protein [Gimesia chilikensis]|uniref:Uncharacterized protein n=1 Tax=Gimesia chilikensis TaxID=2605989 RepID=A0A517PKX5_9PLAN|nr:hypothetical protein [Gimesia chilikensis]QDT20001.1 hypothetical protein HG66A1_17740 [Gimesia chilikensis]
MIFSRNLILLTFMFVLLAAPAIESSEQKENAQKDKPFSIPEKIKKKQVGKWEASKAMLLRSGKQLAVVINAKRTNYELSDGSEKITTPVTVFSDSESGSIWAGREQVGYLETDNKILGFQIIEYMIFWSESSLNHDPKSTSPDITNRFEKDITGGSFYLDMDAANEGQTNLKDVIKNPEMCSRGSGGSTPIVTGFQWDKNLLKLRLIDQTKQYEATVWIDMKSRKAKKAEEKRTKYGEKIFQEQVEAARVRADKMAKEKNNQ